MTIDEFNKTGFGANTRCIFKMKTREVITVSFDQQLIGLKEICDGSCDDDIEWVRCENVAII